jgi:hypothetical protein
MVSSRLVVAIPVKSGFSVDPYAGLLGALGDSKATTLRIGVGVSWLWGEH